MLITIAKILLFPLVIIGYILKIYDKILFYLSKRFHIGKQEKERIEEWWE